MQCHIYTYISIQIVQTPKRHALLCLIKGSPFSSSLTNLPIHIPIAFPSSLYHLLSPSFPHPHHSRRHPNHHNRHIQTMYSPPPMLHAHAATMKLKHPLPSVPFGGIKPRGQKSRMAREIAHHAAQRDFADIWG
jgi:hypothetical protein